MKSIFDDLEAEKTAVFAILGALNFGNLVDFSLQTVQIFYKNSEPLNMSKNARSRF